MLAQALEGVSGSCLGALARSRTMAGGGGGDPGVLETPTYICAAVFAIFLLLSLFIDKVGTMRICGLFLEEARAVRQREMVLVLLEMGEGACL